MKIIIIEIISVTEMCVDCIDGERSPTCWSTCHDVTKRGGFSLDDVLVKVI